jgi:hypothetical protein
VAADKMEAEAKAGAEAKAAGSVSAAGAEAVGAVTEAADEVRDTVVVERCYTMRFIWQAMI